MNLMLEIPADFLLYGCMSTNFVKPFYRESWDFNSQEIQPKDKPAKTTEFRQVIYAKYRVGYTN